MSLLSAPRLAIRRLALADFYTQSARASSSAAAQRETAASTPQATSADTTHYRITLRRSAIGLPKQTNKVLESLGLRKRLQSIYRPKRADIAGMILAVKELVHVENVRRLDGKSALQDEGMIDVDDIEELDEVEELDAEDVQDSVFDPHSAILPDQKAVWLNESGEVVDWGGRQARKAPRGYHVVGNISNEARNRQIQEMRSGLPS